MRALGNRSQNGPITKRPRLIAPTSLGPIARFWHAARAQFGRPGMPRDARKLCARCCKPIAVLTNKPESANSRLVPFDDDNVRKLPPAAAEFREEQQAALGVTDDQLSERLHHDIQNKCFSSVQLEIDALKAGTADSVDSVASSWALVRWPAGEAARLRAAPTRYGSAPTRLS